MAKKAFSYLLKVLAVTWMIVAYFMIRSMELKSQAEINRKELTMDMIKFHVVFWSSLLLPFILFECIRKSRWRRDYQIKTITIVGYCLIAGPLLIRANYGLIYEAWTYNDDIPEEVLKLPTESYFLLIVFYAVTFCTCLITIFLSFACMMYPCFFAMWCADLNKWRRRPADY
jgi:multisubunit Na+/H+ antiporter MnhE subunit